MDPLEELIRAQQGLSISLTILGSTAIEDKLQERLPCRLSLALIAFLAHPLTRPVPSQPLPTAERPLFPTPRQQAPLAVTTGRRAQVHC